MKPTLKNLLIATVSITTLAISSCKKDPASKTPKADFIFTGSDQSVLPVIVSTTNTTTSANTTFRWTYNNTTSTETSPAINYSSGGIYYIKLVATNANGSDSVTKEVRIAPYTQAYTSYNGATLSLFAWEGNKVTFLSRNSNLDRVSMFKWLKALDTTYGYYKLITGGEPTILPRAYIDKKIVIADVPSTCSPAGCGNYGTTGVELQNAYFDIGYNAINSNSLYDEGVFFESAFNFWFYGDKLSYKANDPVAEGFAVFMRFMAIDAAGVNGSTYTELNIPFNDFRQRLENLVNDYLANSSLNWSNTLGVNTGVPGSGLRASDLFASFVFELRKNYGGENFVKNIWKQSGTRPNAITTQDAVDNFFLAACVAANKNLSTLFQTWRWSISASATTAASKYP